MKRLFFILLILFFAVFLGIKAQQDPGYLLIAYKSMSVEMTLWFAVLFLFFLFLFSYLALRILGMGFSACRWVRHWPHFRRQEKEQVRLREGLRALVQGDWPLAEKQLSYVTKQKSELAYFYSVQAANAAQASQDAKRRDAHLETALTQASDEKTRLAVMIARARMLLVDKDYLQAMYLLQEIHKQHPKNNIVLALLYQAAYGLEDWPSLSTLLPLLRKYKVLSNSAFDLLEETVVFHALERHIAADKSLTEIKMYWRKLSRNVRSSPMLISAYAKYLSTHNGGKEAINLLTKLLKQTWDARCVEAYGLIDVPDVRGQIAQAEAWLKQHSSDATLFLCLGRLYARHGDWQKACSYFESSIKQSPSISAYAELSSIKRQA